MLQEKFKKIADKIREKLGTTELIKPNDFADKIEEVYQKGSDNFWDNYQNFGNRRDYSQAFCGAYWNDNTYNPKYPIIIETGPTNGDEITSNVMNAGTPWFLDSDLEFHVQVRIKSTAEMSAFQVFAGSQITNLKQPILFTQDFSFVNSYLSSYDDGFTIVHGIMDQPEGQLPQEFPIGQTGIFYSQALKTIPLIDGYEKVITLDNNNERTDIDGPEQFCLNLGLEHVIFGENIRFSNDFAHYTFYKFNKLDKESLNNIVEVTKISNCPLLYLNASAVNTAFETATGLQDGIASEEWQNLISGVSVSYYEE